MPTQANKLSRFWQELKRIKVIRVITVYSAASFVILELVSIIVEPLRLPEWTLTLVFVLLCIGFAIAFILAWIYDVTPEGIDIYFGLQKTPEINIYSAAVNAKMIIPKINPIFAKDI
jgi:fucose permease